MSTIYQQTSGIPARNVEGMMAVITPRDSEIHQLNDTATLLWQGCEGGATREQLIQILQQAYPEVAERVAQDVDQFLQDALGKGILTASA